MNVSQYMAFFLTGFFPCFLVLVGMWMNNKRFDSVDKEKASKDVVNTRFDNIDEKLSDLTKLVQHFIDLHINHGERISKLEEKTRKL